MSLDRLLVDRLADTMEAAKTDTGPQGTTLVDVLCAAVAPPPPLGQAGSPKRAKYGPHHQSLVTIANRLGVGVHRMYSGVQRKIQWDSGTKDMLYTYSEDYSPTNCQCVTRDEKQYAWCKNKDYVGEWTTVQVAQK